VAQSETTFGQVDADGTVLVEDGDWRSVGQVVDVPADEALRLLRHAIHRIGLAGNTARAAIQSRCFPRETCWLPSKARCCLTDAHAVGDLNALRSRVGVIAESIVGLKVKQDAERQRSVGSIIGTSNRHRRAGGSYSSPNQRNDSLAKCTERNRRTV